MDNINLYLVGDDTAIVGISLKFAVPVDLYVVSFDVLCDSVLYQNATNYYNLLIKFVENELYHPVGPPASEIILFNNNLLNLIKGEKKTVVSYDPYYNLNGLGNLVFLITKVGNPRGLGEDKDGNNITSRIDFFIEQYVGNI